MQLVLIHLIAADSDALGRFDIESLPLQNRIEIFVESFMQTSESYFLEWVGVLRKWRDDSGDFLDISDWRGLTFDKEGNLTHFQLVRALFTGSLDFHWLPSTVLLIEFTSNTFYGEIDLCALPSSLRALWLNENSLTGSVNLTSLPPNLQGIDLSKNKFSGEIDVSRIPLSLNVLFVRQNKLSGVLDLSALQRPPHFGPWMKWTPAGDLPEVGARILLNFSENLFEAGIMVRDVEEYQTFNMFRQTPSRYIVDGRGKRRDIEIAYP